MSWRRARLVTTVAVVLGAFPSAPEHVNFWDAQVKRDVAASIVAGRGPTIGATPDDPQYVRRVDEGRAYTSYGLLACLMYLPSVVLERHGIQADALPTLAMLGALAWLLMLLAESISVSPLAGAYATLLVCLGTPLWPMAAYGYDNLVAALGLTGILFVASGQAIVRSWFWLGVGLGAAFMIREDCALLAVPVAVALVLRYGRGAPAAVRRCAAVVAGGLPGLVGELASRAYRFGPLRGQTHFRASIFADWFSAQHLLGIAGLVLSPGKGALWYGPPLLVCLLIATRLRHNWPQPLATWAAYTCVAVLFFGRFTFWHGDWCWGPRYVAGMYVVVALLGLELGRKLESSTLGPRVAALVVLGASVFFQLPAMLGDPVNGYLGSVITPLAYAHRLVTTPYLRPPLPADQPLLYFSIPRSPLLVAFERVPELLQWIGSDHDVQASFIQAFAAPLAVFVAMAYLFNLHSKTVNHARLTA